MGKAGAVHITLSLLLPTVLLAAVMSSCFTGVEGTKAISQKDVKKAYKGGKGKYGKGDLALYTVEADTFPKWEIGKMFYVSDDNIRYILGADTQLANGEIALEGTLLTYRGYIRQMSVDGNADVSLLFADDAGRDYILPTGKTMEELEQPGYFYDIPFMIDIDEVMQLKSLLVGMKLYVRTPMWYNAAGEMIKGRKFVKVDILDVVPGNKVFPYMVKFSDGGREAYLYMSSSHSAVQNRSLVDLFSIKDIRDLYPTVSDENWARIIDGDVALDMTKDECRLSLGAPKSVDRRTTINGLVESWAYETGVYLVFENGLLRRYRK